MKTLGLRAAALAFAASLCALLGALATPLRADTVADFYRGRTLKFVSGFSPNGEYDSQLRILARHIGRHIPGRPQIVASSMPGAGSIILGNHLYKVAEADGTFVGMLAMQVAVEPFLKNEAIQFDPLRLNWIGSLERNHQYCAIAPAPGIPGSFEEMLRKDAKETPFGTSAPSSEIYRNTAVLKNLLGARIRLVTGYGGMPPIKLALQRGEVNGVCGLTAAALRREFLPELASGRLKLVLQINGEPTAEFGKVPHVFDYANNEDQRELLNYFYGTLTLGRPIAVPPAVPPDRVAALRAAFEATLKDEAFLQDAKKISLDLSLTSGTELADQVRRLSKYPEAFFAKVRAAHK
jgi:tripartite-type tricarboxylate transporter receptor subunit TctC